MTWVIGVLLSALVLRVVAAITTSLEVENWRAALTGAVVITVGGFLGMLLWTQLGLDALWQLWTVMLVANTLSVALAGLLVSGMAIRGVLGIVLGAVGVTLVDIVSPFILAQLFMRPYAS